MGSPNYFTLNKGTMGQREKDTEGTFRDDAPNYGMPGEGMNMGHEGGMNMGHEGGMNMGMAGSPAEYSISAAIKSGAKKVKDWASKYDWTLRSSAQGGKSLVAPTSEGGKAGFAGDVRPRSKRS